MRKLLFLLIFLPFLGCTTNDDDVEPEVTVAPNYIKSYRTAYMDYPMSSGIPNPNNPLSLVKLEYDPNGNIVKRWGGLVPVNPSSGYSTYFLDGIFEEISYQNNQIIISKKDTIKAFDIYPERRILTLQNGKIVTIIKELTTWKVTLDTTYLYYTANRLTSTVSPKYPSLLTKNFYYDNTGNLSTTKAILFNRYYNDTLYTETETFLDYDNAPNPLKHLMLFDELFRRSLSNNNYRRYTFERKDKNGNIIAYQNRNWQFNYDSNANVIFDK